MPEAADFLTGFGLTRGAQINGYILQSAASTHESITRYQEYRYSITLTFQNLGNGTYNDLYFRVYEIISQEHVIYGIRNPYRCIIDVPQYGNILEEDNGNITFKLIGHSYRIHN